MRFRVRYLDRAASTVREEWCEASDEAGVKGRLEGEGHAVLAIQREGAALRLPGARGAEARAGRFDVGWWCQELRTLVQAGMTVVEAIEALWVQSRGSSREGINALLLKKLQEGVSLSGAMRAAGVFPLVLVAGVTASERTSTLAQALADYLSYHRLQRELRNKAISAAIYPSVVVGLGAVIGVFLLVYVVPRFTAMYADFHGTLSWATQLLLLVSAAVHSHQLLLAGGALAMALAAGWAWRAGWVWQWLLDGARRVPMLRHGIDDFRLAKLYQSLALMFRGGYTLDEALAVCAGLHLGADMEAGVASARGELVRGKAVSHAFAVAGFTDVISVRLLGVGERSGGFDAVLQAIADRHAEAFGVFVDRATRVIEPLLLTVVAMVVAGIVVLMYMPIFDMASSIQ